MSNLYFQDEETKLFYNYINTLLDVKFVEGTTLGFKGLYNYWTTHLRKDFLERIVNTDIPEPKLAFFILEKAE